MSQQFDMARTVLESLSARDRLVVVRALGDAALDGGRGVSCRVRPQTRYRTELVGKCRQRRCRWLGGNEKHGTMNESKGGLPSPEGGQAESWHSLAEAEIYSRLDTTLEGLSDEQNRKRLIRYGENVLPVRKPPSPLTIFLHQFKSPLILSTRTRMEGLGADPDRVF